MSRHIVQSVQRFVFDDASSRGRHWIDGPSLPDFQICLEVAVLIHRNHLAEEVDPDHMLSGARPFSSFNHSPIENGEHNPTSENFPTSGTTQSRKRTPGGARSANPLPKPINLSIYFGGYNGTTFALSILNNPGFTLIAVLTLALGR